MFLVQNGLNGVRNGTIHIQWKSCLKWERNRKNGEEKGWLFNDFIKTKLENKEENVEKDLLYKFIKFFLTMTFCIKKIRMEIEVHNNILIIINNKIVSIKTVILSCWFVRNNVVICME